MSEFFVRPEPPLPPGTVTDVALVQPKRHPDGSGPVIVLDRVTQETPPYCVHGRVTCLWCDNWCWLGDRSHDIVKAGEAAPICMECATAKWKQAEALGMEVPRPIANAGDHRRADGPH